MRIRRVVALSVVGLLLGAVDGCRVFDESLLDERSVAWRSMHDRCPIPDTEVLNSDVRHHKGSIALNAYANDIQSCGELNGFDGPDGLLAIGLAARERVHVDVSLRRDDAGSSPVDLGLYLMSACTPASCIKQIDRCPSGRGEKLDFVADKPGTYYFGVDSRDYDRKKHQPIVDVAITFPRCGDGVIDPGETCDAPGNPSCTTDCLARLVETGLPVSEVEPNDDYAVPNIVVVTPDKPFLVQGYIGGECDLDFYVADVPEGRYFLRATMLDENGSECPAGTPPMVLELAQVNGTLELGNGVIPASVTPAIGANHCPQWDETTFKSVANKPLPPGRYVIEVAPSAKGEMPVFAYQLKLELISIP